MIDSAVPTAVEAPALPYPAGPVPILEGSLVGVDAEGRLVPVNRAVRFVGVAKEASAGDATRPVEVAQSGRFAFGFVGWTPTFADKDRTVWAFSATEVAGAPLRTPFEVGRIVSVAAMGDGRPEVRVEIDVAAAKVS